MRTCLVSGRRPLSFSLARLTSSLAVSAVLGLAGSGKAATLNWEPDGVSGDPTGGSGTWNTTSLFWDNFGTLQAWNNLANDIATFGTGFTGPLPPFTVTINTGVGGAGVAADSIIFNADGYTIVSDEASELLTLTGIVPTITVAFDTDSARINSRIAGTAGLTKNGNGTLILGGANVFSGGTTINVGTLALNSATPNTALGSGPVTILANSGVAATNTAVLRLLASEQIADASTVTITTTGSSGATFDLNEFTETIGGLSMTGTTVNTSLLRTGANGKLILNGDATLTNARDATGDTGREILITGTGVYATAAPGSGTLDLGGAARTITVNNIGTQLNMNATIETAIVNGGIIKEGSQVLILNGSNPAAGRNSTFAGGVTVNAGAVRGTGAAANTSSAFGTGTITLAFGAPGVASLELRNNSANINVAQGGTVGANFVGHSAAGFVNYGNAVTIPNTVPEVGIDAGNNGSGSGNQLRLGTLNTTAGLQLDVTSANNYTLAFNGINLGGPLMANPTTGNLLLNNLSGSQSITMIGTGDLLVGGNGSAFSGQIIANSGTLRLVPSVGAANNLLGTGTVTLPPNPTLGVSPTLVGGTLAAAGTPGGLTARFYQMAAAGGINTGPLSAIPTASTTVSSLNDATFFNRAPVLTGGAFTNGLAVYSGLLNITTAGDYVFQTAVDDQSQLVIDGVPVVSVNTGAGGTAYIDSPTTAPITLSAGVHTITVKALNNGSGGGFRVGYRGPDSGNLMRAIPSNALRAVAPLSNVANTGINRTVAAGESLTLDGGGTDLDGGINNLTFSGGGTLNVTNAGGTGVMTISGTTTLQAAPTFFLTTGSLGLIGDVVDSGGPFTITKDGNGTLILAGAKSFGGALNVIAGGVQVTHPNSLGATSQGTTVSAGSVLDLNGVALGAEPLTLNGVGLTTTTPGALYNSTSVAASHSGTIGLGASNPRVTGLGDITLSGVISDGVGASGWSKGGPNTLTLSGANTFTQVLTVTQGVLKVGSSTALGTTAGNTVISAGAVVDLNGFSTSEPFNINGAGITNFGPAINGGANTLGALINSAATASTVSGAITMAAASSIGSPTLGPGGDMTVSAPIGGAFTLTKVGGNTLTLTAANTFTGTIVNSGTLVLSGAGTIAGVTLNPGTTINLDNSGNNVGNRFQQRGVVLINGNLNLVGNSGAATLEDLGNNTFTINGGQSVVTLTPSAGFGLKFNAGTTGNALVRTNNGTALFRGTNLGGAPGAGVATISFTGTLPTVGQAGAAGTLNRAIIPWALVDTSATGQGISFATQVNTTEGMRPLAASEISPTITANNNVGLNIDTTAPAGTTLINSLTLNAGGSTLTVGAGNTLNLDSGGLLATSSWTIDGGTLNSNANREIDIHSVGAGTTLRINSVMGNTTGGMVRAGNGTVIFGAQNTFTGSLRLNGGTTVLSGGSNTIFFPPTAPPAVGALTSTIAAQNLILNGGATLDLNGNDQRFGGFATNAAVATAGTSSGLPNTYGTITNTSATPATLRFSQGATFVVPSTITGNLNLVRDGGFTITLTSPLTHTGTTTLNGGVFKLQDAASLASTSAVQINRAVLNFDNSQLLPATRIAPTTPITMRGGAITYFSRSGGTQDALNLGPVTLDTGASLILQNLGNGTTAATGTSTINITNLIRTSPAAQISFGVTTNGNVALGDNPRVFLGQINGAAPTMTNGILPAWITIQGMNSASAAGGTSGTTGNIAANSIDFAIYDSTVGLRAATYSNTFAAGNNINTNSSITLPAGGAIVNALRMGNNGNTISFADVDDVLNLQSGGLISSIDNAARNFGSSPDFGRLTAGGINPGGPRELFIYNGANTLTINARIVNNPTDNSPVSPVFSAVSQNGPTIQLAAANTFTGTAYVNGVILNLSSLSGPAIPGNLIAGGGTSNGTDSQNPVNQTIRLLAPDQFAPTSNVTLNGGTLLDLNTNNATLNNLSFGADGGSFGNQGPAVQTGTGILTINGSIDATNLIQATTIPVIAGNVQLSAGTHAVNIGSFPGAPGQIGLQINAVMSGTGSLNLASGILGLGSVSTVPVDIGPGARIDVRASLAGVGGLTGTGNVTGTTGQLSVGNGNGSASFGGTLTGGVTLVKQGSGNQTLTNPASTATGGAIINGGTLTLAGGGPNVSVTGVGPIVVNRGGTLAGTGQATGGLIFNPGGRASIVPSATAAPLTAGPTSSISALGPVTLNIGGTAPSPGIYQLIDYSGTPLTSGVFAAFTLGSTPAGGLLYGLLNDSANTAIALSAESVQPSVTWTGATNGVWDTATANWTPGNFTSANQVIFTDAGANKNITGGSVNPQAITVTNSTGNDYAISNAVTNTALAGGLVKNGNGTLTLTGANTFSGPISVNGGTLRATVSSAASGLGSGAITFANGTSLVLDPSASTSSNGLTLRSFTGAVGNNVAALRDFTGTATFTGSSFATGGVTTGNSNAAFYPGGPVDNYSNQWTGKVNITTPGIYSFFTRSDDGTRVFIDGNLVGMNDGSHGTGGGDVGFVTRLAVGLHDIRIDFVEGTGGNEATLLWQGPGIPKANVPSTSVFTAENASNSGSNNNVVLGNNVNIPGSMTMTLNGTSYTGVQIGGLRLDPGSSLVIAGASGKQLRASSTQLSGGTTTINSSADVALGQLFDGGTASTIVKDGTGRLIFDNTGAGGAASAAVATSKIVARKGEIRMVGGIGGTSPAGNAILQLDGANLVLDSKGSPTVTAGVTTFPNAVEILKNSTIRVITPNGAPGGVLLPVSLGSTTAGVTLAAGTTLTVDVTGGSRSATALANNFFGNTIVANAANLRFDGVVSGDGAVVVQSSPLNGGNMPAIGANGGITMTAENTYTGATTLAGRIYNTPNVLNAAPLTLTLNGNGSIQNTPALNLTNARLTLDHSGTNLLAPGRVSDALPIALNNSVIQFIGNTAASSGEVFAGLTVNSGLNVVTMINTSTANTTVLNASSLTRSNRALVAFQGSNLGTAPTVSNLIRFDTIPPLVGGGGIIGTSVKNVSILPYAVGTTNTTGTITWGLVSYDDTTNLSVRPLVAAEYTSVNTSVTGATDNARDQINAALAITGRPVNAYVLDNTSTTAAQIATLNGTLGLGSGLLVFAASSGTQQALTINDGVSGVIGFGANEGVIMVMNNPGATINTFLSGTNGLTVGGFGQLTLGADNSVTLTGPITLNGQLSISADGALGSSTNAVNMNGGILRFGASTILGVSRQVKLLDGTISGFDTATGTSVVAGPLIGGGSLVKINANSLQLNDPSYTGKTEIYGGTLVTTTTPQGDVLNNGTLAFTQATSGAYTGTITGNGSVVINASGQVVTLGDPNDPSKSPNLYSNGTTVNAGSTLRGTTTSLVNSIATGGANAAVVYDQSFDGLVDSTYISGSGTLTKQGTGKVTLAAAQTFTGGTSVTGGTLALGASNILADTVPLAVNGGTFDLGSNSDTVGPVSLVNGSITGTTGALSGSSYAVENGTITAILGGSGAFNKSTAGTVVLSGANTYTGPTAINGGTLIVNGTNSGAGGITVGATGTLAGIGTLAGFVSAQPGSTIAPGVNGLGRLTVAGLQMVSGSSLELQVGRLGATAPVAGVDYDQLRLTGNTLDLGNSTLTLSIAGNIVIGDIFTVILNQGTDVDAGTFAGLANAQTFTSSGYEFRISYFDNPNTGIFETDPLGGGTSVSFLVTVPEPGSALLLAAAAASVVGLPRRRRNGTR